MSAPPLVDAHHHVWDLAVRDQEWISGPELAPLRRTFSLSDLHPLAENAGFCATVMVQTVAAPEETPEMLAQAAADPLVAGVVGWTDLTAPDVKDALARLRDLPGGDRLVGIRHQVQSEPDPRWLLREDVTRGLSAVNDADLAYDLVVLPHQLPAATAAARRLPGLRFILDHIGKPAIADGTLEPWASQLRALAAEPNTLCKLSGLVTEADWYGWTVDDLRPFAETVLDAFGPNRIMYGSDWPVCTVAAEYAQVLDAARALTLGLSPDERDDIFARTAVSAYRLRVP
ncbi:amidohydrolase family protein [Streptomyces sp. NBC_00588]|jgi:L-fuconolactonase|uniref:amidohydrolase family protein n=1 Tax=Streptomyces sp. NBC_00588 TaxID=2975784 RepID=UPI002E7FF257|nr:amidohydrolase family protein [Streptomyces sp. NBC_00588]WUB33452.1 amidohydrolase family protein [Streptomyces sp. NBC_00588]